MERIQRALEIARLQRSSVVIETRQQGSGIAHEERTPRPEPTVISTGATEVEEVPRHSVERESLRKRKVVLGDESSVAAHAYRMLRAQILQRVRAAKMRVIGIVSATTGEGKTLTAINLALSLAAEPNQRITLVDLDLKRPAIARILGIAPQCGLCTWLSGGASAASVQCELEGFPRLRVVPTLAPLPGSSEMLAGSRTRQLFEEIGATDGSALAVVDLPPVLLSDDVLTAAPLIDGFVLVITEGQTLREDVERVFQLLGRNRIIGTVLNGSSASEQRTY
jgi:protein-tyrosine kinase